MNKVGNDTEFVHQPVMLTEVLEGLAIKPAGRYLDATYGRGGHTQAMLQQISANGRLLALDRDPQAAAHAQSLVQADGRFCFQQCPFSTLAEALVELNWPDQNGAALDGVLLDVGVSSPQLDDAQRGFSFMRDGPLDMRMDPHSGESAAAWLNRADEREIAEVLWRYGEERRSRQIARAIVNARGQQPLSRTAELAQLIAACSGRRPADQHPATRSFQAIRIHLNDELRELEQALHQAVAALNSGGRLVVISFHSLEDRLVKQTLRRYASAAPGNRRLPALPDKPRLLHLIGKAQRAAAAEVAANPRARSAVLRVAERL